MQMFMVMALSVFISVFGVNQYLKYSQTNLQDMKYNLSQSNASNIFIYNDLAYQYLLVNYQNNLNTDATFNNYVNYNSRNNFDLSSLNKYYSNSYSFKEKYKYRSTYFLYKVSNDVSAVPSMYLLTTWDSNNVGEVISAFSSLNSILNSKKYNGDTTYWVNVIFGEYNGGKVKIASLLSQGLSTNNNIDKINQVINILNNQGFKMGTYFYLTPVYMNN